MDDKTLSVGVIYMKKDNKFFAREEHFCPYNKNCTCSGWTCDSTCEVHPDYEDDYDLEELENLYQSGELEPDIAKAYEIGKNYGFDKGLSEGSLAAEDNYILGYKDCFLGENPVVYNEELNELLEQENSFEDYDNSVPAGIDIDTDIIDSLEVLKNELIDLKRGYLDREDIDDKQFINRVMSMLHTIGIIQETYVKEELFRYLGYK